MNLNLFNQLKTYTKLKSLIGMKRAQGLIDELGPREKTLKFLADGAHLTDACRGYVTGVLNTESIIKTKLLHAIETEDLQSIKNLTEGLHG